METRVERQRLAFRDSERRSLGLVPTEKRLAQVEWDFATGSYVLLGFFFLAVGKQNGQLLKGSPFCLADVSLLMAL